MRQVKCGCEFNAETLVSLCTSHAAYFSEKFRREAPEKTPLNSKQETLRNQLLVAAVPAAIGWKNTGATPDKMADDLVKLATCIAART